MSLPPSIQGMLGGEGMTGGAGGQDPNIADTAEQVEVSSLALLKMLKHGRAGVPMEVMGLTIGEFTDDYTIRVIDVFSMPQSGNSVSVEAIDPAYQAEMLEMLQRTNRPEIVVGWYHSHPGFGCWFSGTDVNTQQSFEQLSSRAIGIVVDPIQSVKGKVVIDCFRLINPHLLMLGQEPRQTTSNIGHLSRPTITALVHGLNRHYYSIVISYKKTPLEQKLLSRLRQPNWAESLKIQSVDDSLDESEKLCRSVKELSERYANDVENLLSWSAGEKAVNMAGKLDSKKRLEDVSQSLLEHSTIRAATALINALVF